MSRRIQWTRTEKFRSFTSYVTSFYCAVYQKYKMLSINRGGREERSWVHTINLSDWKKDFFLKIPNKKRVVAKPHGFSTTPQSAEGGIWTHATLHECYSLSRGAPLATWVLPRMASEHMKLAEREGFEPPVPCGITGFQDQRLKPLGHLSKAMT